MKQKKAKIVRYLVTGKGELSSHAYSAEIPYAEMFAVDCAKHWTMRGEVYAVDVHGDKTLVYSPPQKKNDTKDS